MALNPALRKMVMTARAKYAGAVIIDQVKSDLSELLPTLQIWTDIIRHMQPVSVDAFTLAVGLRDEARKIAADIDSMPGNVTVAVAMAYHERVRGLERAYSHVQPTLDAEISRSVEWADMVSR